MILSSDDRSQLFKETAVQFWKHIVPILYQRCTADLGLVSCATPDASNFSGADSFVNIGVCGDNEAPVVGPGVPTL